MVGTEKEVAFRKRRRDYAIRKPKNAIRAGTEIIRMKPDKRFLTPQNILAKARAEKTDKKRFEINSKREASQNFPQPGENDKVALVIRTIPKKENISKESNELLLGLRLINQFDGCFIALTPENRQKLKSICHLITYGTPSKDLVRQLIHTKAFTVQDGAEVPLTSNKIIKDSLGSAGQETLEDLVFTINKAKEALDDVCKFLAPFHFNKTRIQKTKALITKEGGGSGWRGPDITQFVQSIL